MPRSNAGPLFEEFLAQFWADALGWQILSAREREVVLGEAIDAPLGLCLMPAGPARKTVKNRVHLDLTTTADDRDAEINEFCVVRPKGTLLD
jgi:hypothetical protein